MITNLDTSMEPLRYINLDLSTELLDRTNVICLNVPWETVSPKKIVRMLVLPLQLFQDDLQCTLMNLAP